MLFRASKSFCLDSQKNNNHAHRTTSNCGIAFSEIFLKYSQEASVSRMTSTPTCTSMEAIAAEASVTEKMNETPSDEAVMAYLKKRGLSLAERELKTFLTIDEQKTPSNSNKLSSPQQDPNENFIEISDSPNLGSENETGIVDLTTPGSFAATAVPAKAVSFSSQLVTATKIEGSKTFNAEDPGSDNEDSVDLTTPGPFFATAVSAPAKEASGPSSQKQQLTAAMNIEAAAAAAAAVTPCAMVARETEPVDPSMAIDSLFRLQATIVGKRFYEDKLHDGELVYLVREPENPYDRNAIKVTTVNHQQVGHISAGSSFPNIAACLAPILDYMLDPTQPRAVGAEAEAISVEGTGSKYSSRCIITLVGSPDHRGIIARHLNSCHLPYLDMVTNQSYNGYYDLKLITRPSPAVITECQQMTAAEVMHSMDAIWGDHSQEQETHSLNSEHTTVLKKCLKSKLFDHQKVGVAWMLKKESNNSQSELPPFFKCLPNGKFANVLTRHHYLQRPQNIAGGILADSMGLGKSLQLLSLILANPPPGRQFQAPVALADASSKETASTDRKKAPLNPEEFYRQQLARENKGGLKTICGQMNIPVSGSKDILINRILMARREISGPSSQHSDSPPAPTMIVCPLSVISSWQTQLATHVVDGTVKLLVYHSHTRNELNAKDILSADIVLTTYDILASEFREELGDDVQMAMVQQAKKPRLMHPLWEIKWWRIILDEAHIIRTLSTRRTKAVLSLTSTLRWVVTGTLVVNSVADLEAPCQFLRLEPFSSDAALFKRYLVRPMKNGSKEAFAMVRALMKSISLRREKDAVLDLQLPPKNEVKVFINLNAKEQEAYSAIHEAIQGYHAFVLAMVGADGVMQHSHTMLSLITRLRQACLDLRLVPADALVKILSTLRPGNSDTEENVERLSLDERKALLAKFNELFLAAGVNPGVETADAAFEVEDCLVCFEPLEEATAVIFRSCKHSLCQTCVGGIFTTAAQSIVTTPQQSSKAHCPMCRSQISREDCLSFAALQSDNAPSDTKEKVAEACASSIHSAYSSKTLAVLAELEKNHRRGEKTVIFSSFTSYLDLLSDALSSAGYDTCRIDGKVPQKKRAIEIQRFTDDDKFSVMLCSLKACGVGITLTRACNLFLTDLWWAPSVDLQAIDRVHRIGQTKPVNVLRFLVRDSIDEKIFDLQLKKIELSQEVTKPLTRKELSALRANDIMGLLN